MSNLNDRSCLTSRPDLKKKKTKKMRGGGGGVRNDCLTIPVSSARYLLLPIMVLHIFLVVLLHT